MATLASNVQWTTSSPDIRFDFSYEKERVGTTQKYKITVSCSPVTGDSYYGYPIYLEIKLSGLTTITKTLKGITPYQWSSARTYTTDWLSLSGKVTGTTSLSIRIYSDASLGSTRNETYSYKLPIDQAISEVSATNSNIGSATKITISRGSSDFTHTLKWSFSTLSGTIATNTDKTSVSWTVPTSFYEKIPYAKYGKCTITCNTYYGSTFVGTSDCTFTATAAQSMCAPTLSPTVIDINANTIDLTGSNIKFVRYFSTAKVTSGASARNSASIVSQKITLGNNTVKSGSATFENSDSASVTVSATDSRGYTTTETIPIDMVDYVKLTCGITKDKISVDSSADPSQSGSAYFTVSGDYFSGNFGIAQNSLSLSYRYGLKGGSLSDHISITGSVYDGSYSATISLIGLDYQKTYVIQVTAVDRLMTVSSKEITFSFLPVFDWGENDFQFNVPVRFPKSLYVSNDTYGIDMNNSDIVGVNNVIFRDRSDSPTESIRFPRDSGNCDCFYIADGVVYIVPDYPSNANAYTIYDQANKPYIEAGDTITIGTAEMSFSGFITSSGESLYFTIPLAKPIIASRVTLGGSILGRSVNGYINGTSASGSVISLDTPSGYTISAEIREYSGVSVRIDFNSAIANATNNTPVSVTVSGSLTLTFS